MVEFHDLKNQLLKGLSNFCKSKELSDGELYTFKMEVNIQSIRDLIPFLKDMTCSYMKSPDGSEVLGLGTLCVYKNSLEMELIKEELKKNPELIYLGALPFNKNSKLESEWSDFNGNNFFLPVVVIAREGHKTFLKVNFKGTSQKSEFQEMNLTTTVNSLLTFVHRDSENIKIEKEDLTFQEDQWDNLISESQKAFSDTELKKVVLARGKITEYDKVVDAFKLFENFKSAPNQYEFFFHIANGSSFISFTPEKLFSLHDNIIVVDSIAGTLKKTDSNKGTELLHSTKDLDEHRFVSNFIKENLLCISSEVFELFKEEILSLPTLFHIHSRYKAQINEDLSIVDIVSLLHPTPAVGGFPRNAALNFINNNEKLNRGLYAGPIGRISKSYTEFAVGIRSLLVKDNRIHFYGGAGIVNKSIASKEWIETGDKIESVQCMM
ncbi:MAG: hypothetical protein CME70_14495 [Halobacteriovorax sp.]|nr:hypothetical protein [Halobacteriovorax sp.]|tara:strand:- start:240717 stop:242027 length:1311 start_codon:yes stop_codon:yes gene_type:complete